MGRSFGLATAEAQPSALAHARRGPRGAGPVAKMAAYLQWRRFVFFDREVVKEPPGPEGSAGKPFALPPGVTVCDSGRGSLVFGDIPEEMVVLGAPALRGGFVGRGLWAWWSCAQAPALCKTRRYLFLCS